MFPLRAGIAAAVAALLLGSVLFLSRGAFGRQEHALPAQPPAAATASRGPYAPSGPVPGGAELVAELGCGACHPGLPVPERVRTAAPGLDDVGQRYSPGQLFAFLQNPQRVRGNIGRARMPDFHLDERESLALTLFLAPPGQGRRGEGDTERAFDQARRRHREIGAELGRTIFRSQNCAGCHLRGGEAGWLNAPALSGEGSRVRPDWLRAFLARPTPVRPFGFHPGTGSRMPDFRLSAEELDSLHSYLLRQARVLPAASEPQLRELSPFARAKAEALLRDQLPCLGCHTLAGEGGRIGPELAGVRERLQPAFVLAMLRDPQAAAPGTVMPPTPMPPEAFELIAAYLLDYEGDRPQPERLSLVEHPIYFPAGAGETELLYGRVCAACHGPAGEGDGYNARFLPTPATAHAAAEYISTRPDDTMYDGIHAGGRILNRSHRMPAFGEMLGRQQLRGLVRHIRALCRCEGPAWSRDDGR